MDLSGLLDSLTIVVSREDIEAGDITDTLASLEQLIKSRDNIVKFREQVDIAFDGYNSDRRELFEIPEMRRFAQKLDSKFPFWLYFLSKQTAGLQCLLLCFLPPFLTREAKQQQFPSEIDAIMTKRWLPAMNQICAAAGLSQTKHKDLLDRVVHYVTNGPIPLE